MGISRAGFQNVLAVEVDKWATETIAENQALYLPELAHWRLVRSDVVKIDYSSINHSIDLVIGGPPCQPFSMGGLHHAYLDSRDMFPEAIRAVRELKPSAFLFENVKGLSRATFRDYFDYIRLSLTYPVVEREVREEWEQHLGRLRVLEKEAYYDDHTYDVQVHKINAADYGVPQHRERIFIVGFVKKGGCRWSLPNPTHSRQALLHSKWLTKDYWKLHGISVPTDEDSERETQQAIRLRRRASELKPWLTVRDALRDLPDPERNPKAAAEYHDHQFIRGARKYVGHTGSPWDRPAKTLKAGVHGVPGGENMLRRDDGSVRYFTIREVSRLQTFPDGMVFHGAWSQVMKQLGNAVPTHLAHILGESIHKALDERDSAIGQRQS